MPSPPTNKQHTQGEFYGELGFLKVARGNNDLFEHPQLADSHVLDVKGWRIGLVHEVWPLEELKERAITLAEELAAGTLGQSLILHVGTRSVCESPV